MANKNFKDTILRLYRRNELKVKDGMLVYRGTKCINPTFHIFDDVRGLRAFNTDEAIKTICDYEKEMFNDGLHLKKGGFNK